MTDSTTQLPVLIVGAGPVGLASALFLAYRQQPVRIIEKRAEPSSDSKAIGINARTLELLEAVQVTPRLLAAGVRIAKIQFRHLEQPLFAVDFARVQHRYAFMLGLPQSETERIFEQRLNEFGIKVERNVCLDSLEQSPHSVIAQVTVSGQPQTIEAHYLIGADGAHSTVRKQLAIPFSGQRLPGEWSLADVKMDTPLPADAAQVIFDKDAMLFAIQFKPGVYRIASNQPNVIERVPTGCQVHDVLWQSNFTVSHRIAERYQVGRILLAGDAAHIHSPLGARGMNLGIEDAAMLVHALNEGTLSHYSTERRAVSHAVVRMVKAQTQLAISQNLLMRLARNHLIGKALSISTIHRRLAHRLLGLGDDRKTPQSASSSGDGIHTLSN